MPLSRDILADWRANPGNPKARLITMLYRLARAGHLAPRPIRLLSFPYFMFYKFVTEFVLGTELPWHAKIGPGLAIHHGFGLVLNPDVVLGANVTLRHGVTIGGKSAADGRSPVVGDNVDIGTGAIILGDIHIGDGATVGAGAVVIRSIPAGATAVGNPARLLTPRLSD
jgi:serine acetyltransferase